jgi:hypothetical protein
MRQKVVAERCPRCGKSNIPGELVAEDRVVLWHACGNPEIEIRFDPASPSEPVEYDFELGDDGLTREGNGS